MLTTSMQQKKSLLNEKDFPQQTCIKLVKSIMGQTLLAYYLKGPTGLQ